MKSYFALVTVAALAVPVIGAPPTRTQVESAANQIVGAWKLEFTTPDGVKRNPAVLVGRQHEGLVAWYVEDDKPESFKKVRLEDDTLVLKIRPKKRKEIEVTFNARLQKENVCIGEATYKSDDGDAGSWSFKGKRVTESDFDESEKWQLRFVTPDEQRQEVTVTVLAKKDQLYGWYSSKELDLPVFEIRKKDDKVVMSITTKTKDGTNVDVTFRGTLYGDRVKGEAEYDLEGDTGTFPFAGSRQS